MSRVHTTKLEQLATLHSRLRTLAAAVGKDFFSPGLLPPTIELSPPEDDGQPVASTSASVLTTTRSSLRSISPLTSTARHPDLTLSALGPLPDSHSVSASTSTRPILGSLAAESTINPSGATLPVPSPSPPYIPPVDVSPAHFARLDKELQRAKLALTERRTQLARTLLHASWLMLEMGMALPSEEEGWDDDGNGGLREDVTEGDRVFVRFLRGLAEAETEMEMAGESEGDGDDGMKAAMRAVEGVEPKVSILSWATELVSTVSR